MVVCGYRDSVEPFEVAWILCGKAIRPLVSICAQGLSNSPVFKKVGRIESMRPSDSSAASDILSATKAPLRHHMALRMSSYQLLFFTASIVGHHSSRALCPLAAISRCRKCHRRLSEAPPQARFLRDRPHSSAQAADSARLPGHTSISLAVSTSAQHAAPGHLHGAAISLQPRAAMTTPCSGTVRSFASPVRMPRISWMDCCPRKYWA